MTKRRWFIIGSLAALGVALVGSAAAFAVGGPHAGRQHLMKRFVATAIDDALDAAQATPEQRTRIHAARDRAFAAVQTHMTDRRGRMDEVLTLFESDRIDPTTLQALRAQREGEHRQLVDAIQSAILEAHDTLTPPQRRAVTEWVRAHRQRPWH